MGSVHLRNLVTRIGGVGCLLDLDWVVEIRDEIAELLDFRHAEPNHGIIAAFNFRQTWIPAIDPALFLGLDSDVAFKNKTALILKGFEGNWALMVDQMLGIPPGERIAPCEMPPLLRTATRGFYSRLGLFHGEPMVVLEPELFYGPSVACA